MDNSENPYRKRTQRDYTPGFKLQVPPASIVMPASPTAAESPAQTIKRLERELEEESYNVKPKLAERTG